MSAYSMWPFAECEETDIELVKVRASDYFNHALSTGICISAILADAFQSPPTTTNVVARSVFVGELVSRAGGAQ